MRFLSNKELENYSVSERKEYFQHLRDYCLSIKDYQLQVGQELIHKVYPMFRNYKLGIEGDENIPKDSNCLFVVNHSNSHDIFTAYEVLSELGRTGSVMVATDCLNPITTSIFNISNATLLDRRIQSDRNDSVFKLSRKILDGNDGVIFGESTWNLHPVLPMHNIKQGVSKISAITQVPIIPTIFEYLETDDFVDKESNLIEKCVIRFGKPVMINYEDGFISQTNGIKQRMIEIRKGLWSDYNIDRNMISDVDPDLYVNHTYSKKFNAFGFTYDSRKEQEYLLFLDGEPNENEYHINSNGEFVPGITEKRKELRRNFKR